MNSRFNNSDFEPQKRSVRPGTILVATTALENTPFARLVILVLQNNDEGTFGVALNRPPNQQILSAWQNLTGLDGRFEKLVHGGPLGGPVFALHSRESLAEHEVLQGVYVSSKSETFVELVEDEECDCRIVFGLVGWKQNDLRGEIEQGLWLTFEGDSEQVFEDPTWLWETSLLKHSQAELRRVVGISGFPGNVLDN